MDDKARIELRAKLLGSFLTFTQFFFKVRTGRDFELSNPICRESHYITLARTFTKIARQEQSNTIINVPPRYSKTEQAIHFVAWCLARNPQCNFIYVSYSHSLAKKQTQTIRSIINLPLYKMLFDVEISDESSAKDNFETQKGGSVYAAGAAGTITGRGAGLKNCDSFGGAIIIDDIHKPSEVSSDTIRDSINEWFFNTLQSRANSPSTPFIFIGQRLHEDDMAAHLIEMGWETLVLPALDEAGNALHPQMHSKEKLLQMMEESPYNYASQYQQNPQPAGGGIFKPEWFCLLDEEPDNILMTFITADTAETDKSWNDATVFSFWGLYRIKNFDRETDEYALHWLDCVELRIEPKDLRDEFIAFYQQCSMHKIRPTFAAIEKKSTGVTLVSVLQEFRGITIKPIERTKASGSKTERFLQCQPYVAQKRISFTKGDRHVDLVIEHMRKITSNDTHRTDDIADTLADSIKIALIDKLFIGMVDNANKSDYIVERMAKNFQRLQQVKRKSRVGATSIWPMQ